MSDSPSLRYMDVSTGQRHEALGLLLKWILQARQRVAPSDASQYDEDVNIYLAHLLLAVIEPDYQALCRRYVALRDVDVFAQAADTDLPQLKALIYRLNADHALLHLSIFEPGQPAVPLHITMPRDHDRALQEGYGRTYYEFAAAYARQRQPASDAPSEVMHKLGESFGTYTTILTEVRAAYMHLLSAISTAQFASFAAEMRHQEELARLRQIQDTFLDAYRRWQQAPNAAHYQQLKRHADGLRALDATFQFTLPDPPISTSG